MQISRGKYPQLCGNMRHGRATLAVDGIGRLVLWTVKHSQMPGSNLIVLSMVVLV